MKNCSTINHRNQSLNLLKGFACIGVVFIHICFPDLFGQIIKKLSGFAVPCFYMIAGFYAYQASKDVIKRRLIKILKIFIYAILLFFIFYLIVHIINNNYQEWLMSLFTLKNLFKSIVFCTIDFAFPLWYLIGMIETYVLWFYVVKNKKESIILKFLPLLFILRFILTSYVLSNNLPWCLKMNFLTCSLSWFLLGYYINLKKQIIIEKCKNSILSIYLSFGCIVALIPVIFRTSIDFSCIGIFFYSAVLFIFAIKYENYEMSNPITYIGEKLSLMVYILHVLIANILHYVNILSFHINNNILASIKPIFVLIVTLFTACLTNVVIKKYFNKNTLLL